MLRQIDKQISKMDKQTDFWCINRKKTDIKLRDKTMDDRLMYIPNMINKLFYIIIINGKFNTKLG